MSSSRYLFFSEKDACLELAINGQPCELSSLSLNNSCMSRGTSCRSRDISCMSQDTSCNFVRRGILLNLRSRTILELQTSIYLHASFFISKEVSYYPLEGTRSLTKYLPLQKSIFEPFGEQYVKSQI